MHCVCVILPDLNDSGASVCDDIEGDVDSHRQRRSIHSQVSNVLV